MTEVLLIHPTASSIQGLKISSEDPILSCWKGLVPCSSPRTSMIDSEARSLAFGYSEYCTLIRGSHWHVIQIDLITLFYLLSPQASDSVSSVASRMTGKQKLWPDLKKKKLLHFVPSDLLRLMHFEY